MKVISFCIFFLTTCSFRSDAPSTRVKEAERKMQLVNDAHVREFASSWVVCKNCDLKVELSEKIPYQLENWIEHRAFCAPYVNCLFFFGGGLNVFN